MYYPQSKIITNQHTNGQELVYKSTGINYTGKYHMLANGKIYTGTTPRDGQIQELTWSDGTALLDTFLDYDLIPQRILPKNTKYDTIRGRQKITAPMSELIEPLYSAPKVNYPSFTRYFLRRTNNAIFVEVNQIDYTAILIKNPKYNYGIYIPFTMPWQTSGLNIAQVNERIVHLTEKRTKAYGFSKYITDYTEFSI